MERIFRDLIGVLSWVLSGDNEEKLDELHLL